MPPEPSAPSAPRRRARICSVSIASASSTRWASPAPRPPGSSRASAPWRSRFTPGRRRTTGCSSALLAQGGFTGNPRIVESRQGFAETLHGSITPEAALERLDRHRDRFLVRDTLFKYHAACYLTHSAIDATRRLRESSGVRPEAIDSIVVEVPASSLDVCNIQTPVNRARREVLAAGDGGARVPRRRHLAARHLHRRADAQRRAGRDAGPRDGGDHRRHAADRYSGSGPHPRRARAARRLRRGLTGSRPRRSGAAVGGQVRRRWRRR